VIEIVNATSKGIVMFWGSVLKLNKDEFEGVVVVYVKDPLLVMLGYCCIPVIVPVTVFGETIVVLVLY
jgi:hypothetical protein